MKKERNAFFQNQSSSSYFYPSNNMPVGNMQMPYYGQIPMATESNSNFYQGPIMEPIKPQSNEYNCELESKIAKLERQINRLDMRLSKLESESLNPGTTNEYNNNMYMI